MTEQEFFQYTGNKIRVLRKGKGLTQQDVAEKAGIYRGDLATFEKSGLSLNNIGCASIRATRFLAMSQSPVFSGGL